MRIDTIVFSIYPTDAQRDCSKNVKIKIKIYNLIVLKIQRLKDSSLLQTG